MKPEELYPCTKAMLVEKMKHLASAYTPEWKFDEEHPDVGTALALIYADMFLGTVRKYNKIPEKNQAAFFSMLGTKLGPSKPAGGYVTFGLSSEEFGQTEVPKGVLVTADGQGEDSHEVFFETQESVSITPSQLEDIVLTDGEKDSIQHIYSGEETFYLFQSGKANLQEHSFCFSHDEVLNLKGPAWVCLQMTPYRFTEETEESQKWLLNEKEIAFEYFADNGFVSFGKRTLDSGRLILEMTKGQPPFAWTQIGKGEGYFIQSRLLKPLIHKEFVVAELRLTSRAEQVIPDVVQTGRGEESLSDIFPFGERPMLYQEVYIASDQVFSKAGAKVRMSFRMDYEKIPLESNSEPDRDWKLVMKRADFIPDPEYDITIERVIWEYYNGNGWSRLFTGPEYSHIFNGGDGSMGQQFTLEFTCPPDVRTMHYNSTESRYIRIRILKMNNLFKMKGHYITPVMSDIRFSFEYKGQGKSPGYLEAVNNMKRQILSGTEQVLFAGLGSKRPMLYFKFTKPLSEGPIKMLFSMAETIDEELPRLAFEYYGSGGFKPFPVIDETGHMKKSGVVNVMGRPDFERAAFWGMEGYWLRLIDVDNRYRKRPLQARTPMVNGIFMNTARVLAVRTMPDEYFKIEPKEKNKVCVLLNQNVCQIEVWVDESRDQAEHQKKSWVKWSEKEDFYLSGPEDRHYVADRNRGTVTFSDGRNGGIPQDGEGETIRICYSCGGGKEGNQAESAVSHMTRTLGYINRVTNPRIISGGCDQETVEEAIRRSSQALRHGKRAVTASDYEALALEASREVLKVRCFPNCNETGARVPGSVTLVVLQQNFREERLYFDRVRNQLLAYICPKLGGNQEVLGRFYVVEPQYLELRCQIELSVRDFNDVFEVKNRVLERIEEFLDPVTGNYDKKGWDIGRIPNEIQISNAIKGISNLHYIKDLRMSAFMQSCQGWIEADLESAEQKRFAVALNGNHQILITVEN